MTTTTRNTRNENYTLHGISPRSSHSDENLSTSTQPIEALSPESERHSRQPHGPRHFAEEKDFDWLTHARLRSRPNLHTVSARKEGIDVNNNQVNHQRGQWSPRGSSHVAAIQNPSRGETTIAPTFSLSEIVSGAPSTMSTQMASIFNLPQQSIPRPFIPSTMALTAAGLAMRDPSRMPRGSSYKGDAYLGSYMHRVPGLPDYLNAGIWMLGLPSDVKHSQIFDAIHCGAVWSLYLKPPTDEHTTAAAQLAFMSSQSAARFMNEYRAHGFQVGGNWITCHYDKFGSPDHVTSETRVLQLEGPAAEMTPDFWGAQFTRACTFQMDRWRWLPCRTPGMARMEFRFSRVDGQAQTCRQMIERNLHGWGFSVRYGPDPCGLPEV